MMLLSKLLNILLTLQIIAVSIAQGQSRPAPHENKSPIDLTNQQIELCKLNDEFLNWHAPPPETNTIRMATAAPTREPDWNGRLQNILGDGIFINWNVIIPLNMESENFLCLLIDHIADMTKFRNKRQKKLGNNEELFRLLLPHFGFRESVPAVGIEVVGKVSMLFISFGNTNVKPLSRRKPILHL